MWTHREFLKIQGRYRKLTYLILVFQKVGGRKEYCTFEARMS